MGGSIFAIQDAPRLFVREVKEMGSKSIGLCCMPEPSTKQAEGRQLVPCRGAFSNIHAPSMIFRMCSFMICVLVLESKVAPFRNDVGSKPTAAFTPMLAKTSLRQPRIHLAKIELATSSVRG